VSAFVAVEELYQVLDERTLEILARRRISSSRRRGWAIRRALLVADLIGLAVAFVIAQQLYRRHTGAPNAVSDLLEIFLFMGSLPGWVVAAKLYGLYDRDEERTDHSTADELVGVFHLVTVCTWGLLVLFYLTQLAHPQFPKLLSFWILATALVTLGRSLARAACRRHISYLQNTVIVGAGDTGQGLALKLLNHPEYGLNLVGFIDSNPKIRDDRLSHLTVLGDLGDLEQVVELLDVERVIVAFTNDGHEELISNIALLRDEDVQIDIVPRLFDHLGPSVSIHTIEGIPLVSLPPIRLPWSSLLIKRALDVAFSVAAATLLLPFLAILAVVIKLDSRGPVFYRHTRVGRGGAEIRVVKLRTMYLDACRGDKYGAGAAEDLFETLMQNPESRAEFQATYKLRNDPRVTRIGKFLRKSSLDELPQLWNVLRGDLSLVGPRALTRDELGLYYGASAKDLLTIRPGITGYWQINGRSRLEYHDRVRLDLAYVSGWSLGLDLEIIAKTVRVLVSKRDAC
jgi:exopolysaccharide biosynthesis polyprenyl glycosylphosphotransferase